MPLLPWHNTQRVENILAPLSNSLPELDSEKILASKHNSMHDIFTMNYSLTSMVKNISE